jgi:hypothetical protein
VQCGSSIALEHAGSFVATVKRFGCSSGSQEWLALHDVLRGHTTEVITYSQGPAGRPATPASLKPLGPPFGLTISRFALDARGDVAWSGSNYAQPGEEPLDVLYLHDAAGTRRVRRRAVDRPRRLHGRSTHVAGLRVSTLRRGGVTMP